MLVVGLLVAVPGEKRIRRKEERFKAFPFCFSIAQAICERSPAEVEKAQLPNPNRSLLLWCDSTPH